MVAALSAYRLTAQCPNGTPPPCGRTAVSAFSVAVLPFVNRARDSSQTPLAEGLADQISANLGQVARLLLKPPASVRFVLGRTPREPARLGHALGSRWLVDGQLLASGGSVRVSVQLIDASSQRVRWSGVFQRPTDDLFAVISAVADSVATAVVGTLAPAERVRLVRRPTTSNAALIAYTRGIAALHRYDQPHVQSAASEFERAVAADSTFAPAWAGLAEAIAWQDLWIPPRQLMPRARAAAQRALSLDPSSSDALAALAVVVENYDWDPVQAESLSRAAVHGDSTNARAWLALGEALIAMGRPGEAVPAYHAALAADTLDEQVAIEASGGLNIAGRTDEALEVTRRWKRLLPQADNWDFDEALILVGAHRCASSPPPRPFGPMALACAGQVEAARSIVDTIIAQSERGQHYMAPGAIAWMYIGLGDKESALHWLARAVEDRNFMIAFARVDPIWDSLRGDPRFTALLERIRPEGR
ncbi:MAG: TPR end-of-group domain-containing protein [Gemmatimonadales bacterium]